MRYFPLFNFQHIILFFIPTVLFVILAYTAFSRMYFRGKNSEEREKRIVHTYPGGIEAKNAPFPLFLILVIIGFLLWAILYALGIGLLGVKI